MGGGRSGRSDTSDVLTVWNVLRQNSVLHAFTLLVVFIAVQLLFVPHLRESVLSALRSCASYLHCFVLWHLCPWFFDLSRTTCGIVNSEKIQSVVTVSITEIKSLQAPSLVSKHHRKYFSNSTQSIHNFRHDCCPKLPSA